jgi:hypothetical protein
MLFQAVMKFFSRLVEFKILVNGDWSITLTRFAVKSRVVEVVFRYFIIPLIDGFNARAFSIFRQWSGAIRHVEILTVT